MTGPRQSRPARGGVFGKRTETVKTLVDPETKEIHERRARLLGYSTLSEYLAELLTVNAHGLDVVKSMHAERLDGVASIGPLPSPEKAP